MEKVRGFEKIVPDSDVKLPVRKTAGSAGYDFYAPYDIEIPAKSLSKIIFTGVKAYMQKNEYLACHIRSGLAYKRGLMLVNAVGVSDSQLYKQAGNAVTVNVAEAIGNILKEVAHESKAAYQAFNKYTS